MSKIRVGVVRGGPSSEYDVSLRTGDSVLKNLNRDKYAPLDVLRSKEGDWYMDGIKTDLSNISQHVDVVWNALHGTYGEDGKFQREMEQFGIPYTGSGVLPSALGMNKMLAKQRFRSANMMVADEDIVAAEENEIEAAIRALEKLGLPLIVKPMSGGSSVATAIVKSPDALMLAIRAAKAFGDVLLEEYIEGKEATVAVVDAGDGEHFVLYPIEIVPPDTHDFFNYDAKYSGASQEIVPGRFTLGVHSALRDLALAAHKAIGARHYSRTDFIVSPNGIYALEINTLPGLTAESLVPKALRASGIELSDFFDHVLTLALKK